MGDLGELILKQKGSIRIANLAMKLAGPSVKEDIGRMLMWAKVIRRVI